MIYCSNSLLLIVNFLDFLVYQDITCSMKETYYYFFLFLFYYISLSFRIYVEIIENFLFLIYLFNKFYFSIRQFFCLIIIYSYLK